MNNDIKNRILEFLAYLKIGQSKFEKNTGLSNGLINNIKNNISTKSLNKISLHYPELNTAWLLTGEGEMLKSDNQNQEHMVSAAKHIAALEEVIELQRKLLEKKELKKIEPLKRAK